MHYKADLIEQHLRARKAPRIEISDERAALLDTGGGVKKAMPRLGPGAFLIHNANSVWIEGVGSNLARLAGAWDDAAMDCLLLLAVASASHGYQGRGDFALESDGRIRRKRVEQEIVPFAFTGVSIAHPRLFDASPDGASRSTWCGAGRSPPAGPTACAWTASGCMSARRPRWRKPSSA